MEEEIDLNTIFNARILNNSQNILLNDTSNTQVTYTYMQTIFLQLNQILSEKIGYKDNHLLIGLAIDRSIISCILTFWIATSSNIFVNLSYNMQIREINDLECDLIFIETNKFSILSDKLKTEPLSCGNIILVSTHESLMNLRENIIQLELKYEENRKKLAPSAKFPSPTPEKLNLIMKEDNLYLIHTSGSTGNKKCVVGKRSGLLNRLKWYKETFALEENELWLYKTSHFFIDGIVELFTGIFQNRTTLILNDLEVKDPVKFIQILGNFHIHRFGMVPSFFNTLLSHPIWRTGRSALILKYIFFSGEALTWEFVLKVHSLFSFTKIVNMYGSSENSGDIMYYVYDHNSLGNIDKKIYVPIGNIFQIPKNTNIFLLNKMDSQFNIIFDNLSADFTSKDSAFKPKKGILGCNGVQICNGYYKLKAPEETYQNEIICRLISEAHIVKLENVFISNDICYIEANGLIYFQGRTNEIVKRYGEKIDLKNIQRISERHHLIKESIAFVLAEKLILLCVKNEESVVSAKYLTRAIRDDLNKKLKSIEIPDFILFINNIPRSEFNNKIDKLRCIKVIIDHFDNRGNKRIKKYSDTKLPFKRTQKEELSLSKIFPNTTASYINEQYILEKIGNIFKDLGYLGVDINSKIYTDIGLTSINTILLLNSIYENFEIIIELEYLTNKLETISQLVNYIYSRAKEKIRVEKNKESFIDPSRKILKTPKERIIKFIKYDVKLQKIENLIDAGNRYINFLDTNFEMIDNNGYQENWENEIITHLVFCHNMKECVDSSPLIILRNPKYINSYLITVSHSGNILAINSESGELFWEQNISTRFEASPSYFDETIYIGGYNGILYALGLFTGEILWEFRTNDMIKSTCQILYIPNKDNLINILYIGSYDEFMYFLDLTGKLITKRKLNGAIFTNILQNFALINGNQCLILYVSTLNSEIYAFSIEFSSKLKVENYDENSFLVDLIWKRNIEFPIFSTPIISEKQLIIANCKGQIYSINKSNGEIMWKNCKNSSGIVAGLVYFINSLIISCHMDGSIICLNLLNGEIFWENKLNSYAYASPFTIKIKPKKNYLYQPSSIILIVLTNGTIIFLDERGQILYQKNIRKEEDSKDLLFSSPIMYNQRVYFGARDNYIYCYQLGS